MEPTAQYYATPQAGDQHAEVWRADETDRRTIFSARPPDVLRCYHFKIHGDNVRITAEVGTSDTTRVEDLSPPLRFSAYGAVVIHAVKFDDELPANLSLEVGYGTDADETHAVTLIEGSGAPSPVPTTATHITEVRPGGTITMAGVTLNVPIDGLRFPVAHPATVTDGAYLIEHEV